MAKPTKIKSLRPEGMTRVEWKEANNRPVTGLDRYFDKVDRGEAKHYYHMTAEEQKAIRDAKIVAKPPIPTLKDRFKEMLPSALNNIEASLSCASVKCKVQWFGTSEQEAAAIADNPSTEFLSDEDGTRWKVEYREVSKAQAEMSKWVVQTLMTSEKHIHEVRLKEMDVNKKRKEAKVEGYGEFEQEKIKEEMKDTGLSVVQGHTGFEYDSAWDDENGDD